MPPPSKSSAISTQPLKILMLHGYTQSGPLFHAKTKALEKSLQKAFPQVKLHYPTAPNRIHKADIPNFGNSKPSNDESKSNGVEDEPDAWGWWRRRDDSSVYLGMDDSFTFIAEVLKSEGPFDGIIGFSQGGAAAGMVASLLEPGRQEAFAAAEANGGRKYPESFLDDKGSWDGLIHPPLKFAVSYSGYGAGTHPLYKAFYEPKIQTPILNFLGSLDTIVEEKRSLFLVDACTDGRKEGRLIYHPGGHFVPSSQGQYVGALIGFIKDIIGGGSGSKEDSVENMDVPF